MRYHILLAAALLSSVCSVQVMAQDQPAPIFISPYQAGQSTYNSRIPTIVQPPAPAPSRTYTRAGRKSYEIVTAPNPFEGTAFGRIRNEISIRDNVSGQHLNQYDYMAVLKRRGNIGELNNVSRRLQTSGVFDPAKYREAMTTPSEDQIAALSVAGGPRTGAPIPMLGGGVMTTDATSTQNPSPSTPTGAPVPKLGGGDSGVLSVQNPPVSAAPGAPVRKLGDGGAISNSPSLAIQEPSISSKTGASVPKLGGGYTYDVTDFRDPSTISRAGASARKLGAPQRIHGGFDDETDTPAGSSQNSNTPIFLR
jgi:hypothetical protein